MSTNTELLSAVGRRNAARRTAIDWKVVAVRWGTVIAALAVWEAICLGPMKNNDYIAPPSEVFTSGLVAVFQPANLAALLATLSRFAEAFVIVAVSGVVLGLLFGRLHRHIFAGARDVVSVLYALPMVPFYPLFVLWLGLGQKSEVAFGVIHGVMPVILITMTASATVDVSLVQSGITMGAGRLQRMGFIVLPAIVPEIVSALKIGAALSLLGVLLAELMISVDGVGTFIQNQITNHQAAPLDAMVVVICIGVIVVNSALGYVERRASRWRAQSS